MSKQAEQRQWICSCGNCTFALYENGEIACAHCGDSSYDEGEWKLPPLPSSDTSKKRSKKTPTNVIRMWDSDAGLRHVLDDILNDKPSYIVSITDGGRVRTWGNSVKSDEEREWLKHRLKVALKLFCGVKT